MKVYFRKSLIGAVFFLSVFAFKAAQAQQGYITTIAGKDSSSYSGDGGPADTASLNFPFGVAVDTLGNVYVADWLNNRIRKINAVTGIITTVAGNGTPGYTGNGGAATAAELNNPIGVAVDDTGNIYIADSWNHVIRKVQASTGKISTVAGNGTGAGGPYGGYSGDGGAATSAKLNDPMSVAVDDSGNIYIADYYNNRIRKVKASNHYIVTVAGNGYGADTTGGYGGDGGPADSAELFKPTGVAVDDSGNIYIVDTQNDRIRKVTYSTGIINTIAGTGAGAPSSGGYSGDGGPAIAAKLYYPAGIALDAQRNVYFTDRYNNRVRKIDGATNNITTIAGNGVFGFSGDGGLADSAQVAQPAGIALDNAGNAYIADVYNNRIRQILTGAPCPPKIVLPTVYDSVCTGTNGIFAAVVTNGGTKPVFQWKLNGNNVGTDTDYYSYTPVHNGDKISCVLTSNASCAFPKTTISDTLKMGIYNGQVKPGIHITASGDSLCSNIPVTFSSSILRGGVNPIYLWRLNGDSIGDSTSITLVNLRSGYVITCQLNSSLTCASPDSSISDTIVMTTDSAVTPTLTITASANTICAGTQVTFTANAVNAGNSPIYNWTINGQIMGGSDSSLIATGLNNGDTVKALLISSLGCVNNDSAGSNSIIEVVNPLPATPLVTQTGDSLISNTANGNQWYFDSASITGATAAQFTPAQNGNYYVIVTDSNGCVSGHSDTISFIIQDINLLSAGLVNIYPNPTTGQLKLITGNIDFSRLEIYNCDGRKVYSTALSTSTISDTQLNLGNLSDGVYVIKLIGASKTYSSEIVLQK